MRDPTTWPYHASFLAQLATNRAALVRALAASEDSGVIRADWPARGPDETPHRMELSLLEDEGMAYVDGTVALGIVRAVGPGAATKVADRVLAEVADALGAEPFTLLAVTKDPALVGAEIAAPPSLEARVEAEEVRFILPGPWKGEIQRGVTGVAVSAAGVTMIRPTTEDTVPWHVFGSCGLQEQADGVHLVIRNPEGRVVSSAPCHGTSDDVWLAAYLEAQAARRRETDEERAERERREKQLSKLLGAIDDDP